jgi:hypothetical protein
MISVTSLIAQQAAVGKLPNETVHLVSQHGPEIVANDGFWSLHIRQDGDRGTAINEIQMVFAYGADWSNAPSGIIMNESTDYFVAAGGFPLAKPILQR